MHILVLLLGSLLFHYLQILYFFPPYFPPYIDKKKNELEQIILHKSYKDADEDKYLKEIEHKSKEAKIMNEIQEELKKQKLEELNAFEQSITE